MGKGFSFQRKLFKRPARRPILDMLNDMKRKGLRLVEAWARLSERQRLQAIDEARRRSKVVKIFVDNDAMVFFNTGHENRVAIDSIDTRKCRRLYGEEYNVRVKGAEYYEVGKRRAPIVTTCVVDPCTVFLAYALDNRGRITRAGVFHRTSPAFHEPLKRLIEGVSKGDTVYVKVAGFTLAPDRNPKKEEAAIRKELSRFGDKVKIMGIELGGPKYQTVETIPMRGIIRTFWRQEKEPRIKRI